MMLIKCREAGLPIRHCVRAVYNGKYKKELMGFLRSIGVNCQFNADDLVIIKKEDRV